MSFNKYNRYSAPVKFTNNCIKNPKQLSGTAAELSLKSNLGDDMGNRVLQEAKESYMDVEWNPVVIDLKGKILAAKAEFKNK